MSSNEMPVWDLSEYYKGIDDKNIDKDISKYQALAKEFNQKYKGRVKDLTIDEFGIALKELEDLSNIGHKLAGFSHLNYVTNMLDEKASALNTKIEEQLTNAGMNLVFWSLEYNKLSDKKQKELIKNLGDYAPYLKRMGKYKKYELSEEVEQTLLAKDITSGSAWVRFYEENMARLEYEVDGKKYNDAEISKLATSKDEETRLKAGYEINKVTKEDIINLGKKIKINRQFILKGVNDEED